MKITNRAKGSYSSKQKMAAINWHAANYSPQKDRSVHKSYWSLVYRKFVLFYLFAVPLQTGYPRNLMVNQCSLPCFHNVPIFFHNCPICFHNFCSICPFVSRCPSIFSVFFRQLPAVTAGIPSGPVGSCHVGGGLWRAVAGAGEELVVQAVAWTIWTSEPPRNTWWPQSTGKSCLRH